MSLSHLVSWPFDFRIIWIQIDHSTAVYKDRCNFPFGSSLNNQSGQAIGQNYFNIS
uniref:Uncharacterized protein n=1 Tax=Tetranychus urticae TaxID=32264 RepID=T1KX08_TETUR